jgi:hypothetical protein
VFKVQAMRDDEVVDCQDLAGRGGQLVVFNDHGRVILISPAGETAVLTPQQAGNLRAALRNALLTPSS